MESANYYETRIASSVAFVYRVIETITGKRYILISISIIDAFALVEDQGIDCIKRHAGC